jgi:hypothetical protein
MAYITIKTNTDEALITLQERLVPSDMESEFFCAHLVERLRWAVEDAHAPVPQPSSIAGNQPSTAAAAVPPGFAAKLGEAVVSMTGDRGSHR